MGAESDSEMHEISEGSTVQRKPWTSPSATKQQSGRMDHGGSHMGTRQAAGARGSGHRASPNSSKQETEVERSLEVLLLDALFIVKSRYN